ncbi:flagella synthesis protein FlgN [sulfur-oxidizing endosymbiont of Gigantopelta aegis]|uniref:flagella synthesis protein FlgN n=1 Tax=sulfur-oxidizing endosymbiont of Gigantopelta aegis TaxID=2794934 RepID=UPI0018DB8D96|nr:flagellar protein FlgN [sulfur-oxidizing endosymbiont of Gigantopelta aegis]
MTPFIAADEKQHQTAHDTNNQTTDDTDNFYTILQQEQACLEQVIELLKTENTAIAQRELKTIDQLLDKKLMLLSKLEQLDKQRQHFFEQQTGMAYQNLAFTSFIQQFPSEAIQAIWQEIKAYLPECKKQNEVNGRMIRVLRDNNDKILQILLGRPQNNDQTYSHLGQASLQKRSALYTSA